MIRQCQMLALNEHGVVQVKTSPADTGNMGDEEEALGKQELQEALRDVGRIVDDEFLDEVFRMFDSDGSGWVGLDEFKCSVRLRTKLEQWTAAMPIASLVASSFVPYLLRSYKAKEGVGATAKNDEAALKMLSDPDPLSQIRVISSEGLSAVCIGLAEGFRGLFRERIARLNDAFTAMERQNLKSADAGGAALGKFAFSMQGGETSDFYNGLGARIGTPSPPTPPPTRCAMPQEVSNLTAFLNSSFRILLFHCCSVLRIPSHGMCGQATRILTSSSPWNWSTRATLRSARPTTASRRAPPRSGVLFLNATREQRRSTTDT